MASLATRMGQITEMMSSNAQSVKSLEGVMSQLALQLNERAKGTFPCQPVANPKDAPGPSV